MPVKQGMGGHGKENFDPATGKFIEDGKANVRHPNPAEAQKIAGGVSPSKIQQDSANRMSAPTPNLGKYAEPSKHEVLKNEFGIEQPKEPKESWDDFLREHVTKKLDMETLDKFREDPRAMGRVYRDVIEGASIDVDPNTMSRIVSSGEIPESIMDKLEKIYSPEELVREVEYALDNNMDFEEPEYQPELVDAGGGKYKERY